MLTDIMVGQYFPGNSFLHHLDPRAKIILLIMLIFAVFIADTFLAYAVLCLFSFLVILVAKIPFKMMLKSIKPLWWIILFTFLIHTFTTSGEVLWSYSFIVITKEGLRQAVFISFRLILLILLSSVLTFTTSPIALTDAIEGLLSPFKRFGLPAHELAMMMTIALRFIPTLLEETDKIMKAQKARGADFSSGNLVKRIKSMVPLLVPLFISAFRRADDLAVAMEARCYRGGENRTRMNVLSTTSKDYWAALAVAFLIALLIYLRMGG